MSSDEPDPPISQGNAGEAESGSSPPAPIPGAKDHGDIPLKSGGRRTLGMRVPARGEGFYFLANASGFGGRYKRRFSLTPDGWAQAWREFVSEDPEAAAMYKEALLDRASLPARKAELAEAYARLSRMPQLAVVLDCALIGGYGHDQLALSGHYDLYFTASEVLITRPGLPEPRASLQYRHVLALRVDGPGAITRGGGFIGGGFGAVGAAEGMIVASALNALTTRTTIQTIIEVQDRTRDFVFFHSKETPQQLRLRLLSVDAKLREHAAHSETAARDPSDDPLERLERLRRLYKDGALTDEEFEEAKRRILAKL